MTPGNDTTRTEEAEATYIPFQCPVCDRKLKVEVDAATFEVACPGCSALIMTPVVGIGPGVRLDDFVLQRRIGRGAMGDVYIAQQRSLSRTVAVKILAQAWGSNPEMSARFQREVKTLARLDHPNIVTAFAAGRARGVHYLAMQFVRGGNLQERIKAKGRISEVEALSVIFKVADALRYAWNEHGLIHRDIKPANIMIERDGEIKLTDLGISKCIYEDESMTHGHRVFGTPFFMSPEQARGRLDLDFRSDQYSLGATLYHLLAGRPPFNAKDVDEVIKLPDSALPPPISSFRTDVSRDCIECLNRMLARPPEKRYPSWSALLDDVGAVISAQATREVVLEPDPQHHPEKPIRRRGRGWAVTGATIAVLALILGLWKRHQNQPDGNPNLVPGNVQAAGDLIKGKVTRVQDVVTTYIDERKEEKVIAQQVAEVMDALDQKAALLIVQGMTDEAIALYQHYDGQLAAETRPARRTRVAELMIPD